MEYYGNNDYRDYLAHHGVKGMKWGVRKTRSVLNRLDRKRAHAQYKVDAFTRRANKAATRFNDDKANKLRAKAAKWSGKVNKYKSTTSQVIKQAKSKGYTVRSQECKRFAAAGRATAGYLIAGIPGAAVAVATAKDFGIQKGTRYGVSKGRR